MTALPLAVLVPACDDERLSDCLASIDEDVEIVVVLNQPTPTVRRIVDDAVRRNPRIVVTEMAERNLGKAYNVGIAASTEPAVLLMDSDCRFAPGTIRRLHQGLAQAPLSKGRVVFLREGRVSAVVARAREHHTGDLRNAYSPPLLLRKDIVSRIGGYFFDDDVHWCEDHEFDQRVQRHGLPIAFDDEAVVHHPPLTVRRDLTSAGRYGLGYRVGIGKGIIRGSLLYGGARSVVRSLGIDLLRLALSPGYVVRVARAKGLAAAAYMVAWMVVFAGGYYRQAFTGYYPVAEGRAVRVDLRREVETARFADEGSAR